MTEQNPYAPPKAEIELAERPTEQQPLPLGGWLIIVAIGVVVSPFRMVISIFPEFFKQISEGHWAALTTAGSPAYNPAIATLMVCELVVNIAMIVAWVVLACLMFAKRRAFPKVFITLQLATLVIQFTDALVVSMLLPGVEAFDQGTRGEIGRTVIACLIWTPYMLMSKRVKATFIR